MIKGLFSWDRFEVYLGCVWGLFAVSFALRCLFRVGSKCFLRVGLEFWFEFISVGLACLFEAGLKLFWVCLWLI